MPSITGVTPWTQRLPARWWVWGGGVLGVLALSSALVLAVATGTGLPQPLGTWYDRTELFVRDTIRLTFKTDQRSLPTADMVYMAPPGILEQNKPFNLIDVTASVVALPASASSVAAGSAMKSPIGLLDPDWQPVLKKP